MSESFTYSGTELDAMNEAENYHRWILDLFKPYMGRHIVEVGAGIGSFSELILQQHGCETFSAVEPSTDMCAVLRDRLAGLKNSATACVYSGTFREVEPQITSLQRPDTAIYVNVLEHVEDDVAELGAVHQALALNGCLLIFVPALSWLHGTLDDLFGHYRRYNKRQLERKLQEAGFAIVESRYFDLPGIAPWWIKYRLLKSKTMEKGAVRFYDRFAVPIVRRMETLIPPVIGKNIIAVGRKA